MLCTIMCEMRVIFYFWETKILVPRTIHLLNIHMGHSTCPRGQKSVLELVHWSVGPDGCNVTMINLSKSELKRVINIKKQHIYLISQTITIYYYIRYFSPPL